MTDHAPCHPYISSAGLPWRTAPLLDRERNAYDAMAAMLRGGAPGLLTLAQLSVALASDQPGVAYTAAFLAGRCSAGDADGDGALTDRLRALASGKGCDANPDTDARDASDAGSHQADVAIEAAMALVLRGDPAHGKAALISHLHAPDPLGDQYKAAFYLAQLGDPSGYGALVDTLNSPIAHYRLMAVRHALAFAPYHGRLVSARRVDVASLLYERLADDEAMVRSEVPFYLEELAPVNLRARLGQVEQHDPSASVRIAARMVLDRN